MPWGGKKVSVEEKMGRTPTAEEIAKTIEREFLSREPEKIKNTEDLYDLRNKT